MAIPKHIQVILDKLEADIQKALLDAIADIKSSAKLAAVIGAIESGNTDDVLRALHLSEEFFSPIDDAIRAAYLQGGRDAMALASGPLSKATSLVFRFNGRNERAEAWIRNRSSTLIVEMVNATREAVRGLLLNGLVEGRAPRSIALDLVGRIDRSLGRRVGGVVGLNNHLAGYLENARQELESGDRARLGAYLRRTLRDARYDATVRAAIESGRPIRADTISKMVGSYSDRLLRFRGERIARTEATAGFNAARQEAYVQLAEAGAIAEEDVVRRWRSAGDDGRTRDSHDALDDKTVLGLHEAFSSPNGARLMHPGDTTLGAGPEEVVNCRCYMEFEVDYIAAQRRAEGR